MYTYLAILERKKAPKKTLKKYFKDNDIILEKIYPTIGVVKILSHKRLILSELKYITNIELDTKKYKINEKKSEAK